MRKESPEIWTKKDLPGARLVTCWNCGWSWYSRSVAVRPKCPVCGRLSGEGKRSKKEENLQ